MAVRGVSDVAKLLGLGSKGGKVAGATKTIVNSTSKSSKAIDVVKKMNNVFLRDLTEEELKGNFSVLERLTKKKGRKSVNWMMFGGAIAYGSAQAIDREYKANSMGKISSSNMYDLVSHTVNPILDEEVENQSKNTELMSKGIQKSIKDYGSAGPDLVFALHDLRNR